MELMTTAGVRPHVWKRDFVGGTLLQQQLVAAVEQEDAEGPVQQP